MNTAEKFIKLHELDVSKYDRTVIAFSGGKDSTLAFLMAREMKCPNIELWHHLVDGREGSTLMDWPITTDYCRKFAEHFKVPIYFSWKEGGIEGEMLRENALTKPTYFETPDGLVKAGGERGSPNTRLKWPAQSMNLGTRWCSSVAKIEVAGMALRNDSRFREGKTLFITGERAEESAKRASYNMFEPHRDDLRHGRRYQRYIDHLRPCLHWDESQVWFKLEYHKIRVHPAYHLGLSRTSCMNCIFGSKKWATIQHIAPGHFEAVAEYEEILEHTINRDTSVRQYAEQGEVFPAAKDNPIAELAMSETYNLPIVYGKDEEWQLPAGAFGEKITM